MKSTRSQPSDIEGVEIYQPARFADERGWLMEIFRSDELDDRLFPQMAYVSVTLPGVVRGPHEHRNQTDFFCFPGPGEFEVRLWDNRPSSPTYRNSQTLRVGAGRPTTLIVPPGVVHAYKNIGEVDAAVINLPNRLYRGKDRSQPVDELRHEDDPNSPFRME